MLFFRMMTDPVAFIVYWILMTVGYFFALKKMPLKRWTCIVPFLAEREMTKVLFRTMRSFYRPFIISVVFFLGALYLGTDSEMGLFYIFIIYCVYGIFLMRLHWRLAKSYGKGVIFRILTILFPPLFMMILGLSKKAEYTPLKLRPVKQLPPVLNILAKIGIVLFSGAEILTLVVVVGYITINVLPPSFLIELSLDDFHDKTKDIKGTEEVVSREDAMGKAASSISTMKTSREKFYPDHSQAKNVVVLSYIVGADLEGDGGLASANIKQMISSTEQGDALTYVVQAGGSKRWFTGGIEDATYGRYEIKGGSLKKVKKLSNKMSMSDEKSLEDFLLWAKEKYPADRYMLVLWDHGGGVAMGYGSDDINKKNTKDEECMNTSEVIKAIKKSGIKYDLIGFDACLMQDIEIAAGLEPYTDYYLASEEVEGGYGWYYTSPFGKLAQDPTISTEDFAVDLLSCYDQMNTIVKNDDGKPDTKATLSLVDTTYAKPAYEAFEKFLEKADGKVREDPGAYADMAVAGSNAYNFYDDVQIDLVDYLKVLNKADYEEDLVSDKEIKKLINRIRACVLYRNKNSAKGINGIAFAFPYKSIEYYGYTSKELKSMSLKTERKVFNDIFSIMAVQRKKASEQGSKRSSTNASGDDSSLTSLILDLVDIDYTKEDWYVKGFEDYNDVEAIVDIPLKETDDGYQIELPAKAWKIITDCQTMVWQKTGKENRLRYLGRDQIGGTDANGNPTISMDEDWVHIGGEVVCYEADPVRTTDEGDVYSGKVPARLNNEENITLLIEWDPVKDDSQEEPEGHVIGYYKDEEDFFSSIFNTRGKESLNTGDTLRFRFDTYDEEGNFVKTTLSDKEVRVIKQADLTVQDAPLGECDIVFDGVLTDIYQRTMTTEQLEMHIAE